MLSRNTAIRLAQLIAALGTLVFLFAKIDLGKIETLISHSIPSYIVLAFLMLAGQIMVSAYRWLCLLRMAGFSPPVWDCIGSFAASSFINSTLPGGVGGDIMRMWFTARSGIPTTVATTSVIADRILNLTALGLPLIIVLLSCMLWMDEKLSAIHMVALIVANILLCACVALIMIAPIIDRFKTHKLAFLSPIISLSRMTGIIFQKPQLLITLLSTILLGYFMQITTIILIAYGLQIPLTFQNIFLGMPIVILLSALPITPGGWGIRESAMVLVFSTTQVTAEAALGLSVLFGICSMLASLPTTAIWYTSKNWLNKTSAPIVRQTTAE